MAEPPLQIEADAPQGATATDGLTLPFERRQKSRQRARLDGGREVAVVLERGRVLRDGDLLLASDGTVVRVNAAPETVSTARADDPELLSRGAYHLGNRHVALQVGKGFLRYAHDHVLDAMVSALGLEVVVEEAPFEPEGGAYGGHGHSHGHGAGDEGGRPRGGYYHGGLTEPPPAGETPNVDVDVDVDDPANDHPRGNGHAGKKG